jgi:pimeloyl-ACP methyl ester carboxylesterase
MKRSALTSGRPARVFAGALTVVGAAVVIGLLMPRGPVTTVGALLSIATGLGVGLLAGFVWRTRWTLLAAPVAFALVFEVVRLGESGPTVDQITFGSTYGIAAFVTGRGIDGVLLLLPMVLGAALSMTVAWRAAEPEALPSGRSGRVARRVAGGVAVVALLALAVGIAMPAGTEPIRGAGGDVLAGSVAELTTVGVPGGEQTLMIRGCSEDAPVLLFLAGGPGGSEIGSMRNLSENLERDFVVATWDQPGTGKSLGAFDPGMTLDGMVDDTLAVTRYLRERFNEDKIYLACNSWGTILGVRAVQRNPELYHAYVGTGQMVDPVETDRMFYEDTLAWAEKTGRSGLVETLRENGAPPYDELWKYEPALSHEHEWNVYPMVAGFQQQGEMPGNIFVEEYTLVEKLRLMGGFLDTFSVLYPQLADEDVDFRVDAPELAVPVYLLQGAYEARGRAGLAREWFDQLRAPTKLLVEFEHSGHKPSFEEPDRFAEVMTGLVLGQARVGQD